MTRSLTIDARFDPEASVWLATSADVPGLVVEADTWPAMIDEVRLAIPDLIELSDLRTDKIPSPSRLRSISISSAPDGRVLSRAGCNPALARLSASPQGKGQSRNLA
jgi:hypothetical protein